MKNPFGDERMPGSYHNLKERMYKKISTEVNDQVFEIMVKAYENALNDENIVLTRQERMRLLSQIVEMVLSYLLDDLGGKSS